ncbi:UNVERIFIED_CONTAM: hypothetical protein BEN50_05760 [Euhalothece sp. KZN 001]
MPRHIISAEEITGVVPWEADTIDFRFLENNEGVPGEEITSVGTGERFFIEVLGSADVPDGIVSLSLDLDYDQALLTSLEGDVLNADVNSVPTDEPIITSEFDFQRNGSLDEATGEIFLGAGAVGNSIGNDGTLDQFALLGFEAAGSIEEVTPTTLDFTVPSENPVGGAAQGDGTAITADNTTLEDPILQINPPPIVFVEVRLFANDQGSPGEEITDDTVGQGQSFFAEILVSAEIPGGIVSFSLDLDFDETVLSSLDQDVLNADGQIPVDNSIITSEFDFQRNGSLDATTGEIFLGAGAVGNSIGNDGNLERFALLQFETTGVAPDGTPLDITVPSTDPTGGAALGDGRAIADVGVDIEQQSVTIPDNQPPVFETAPGQSIDENATAVVTVTAPDPDDDDVTFSLSDGADQNFFTINETTGELSFNEAPDFETPQDADDNNVYEVEVTADDGNGGTTRQDFQVTVNNVNEAPEFDQDAFDFTIPEFVPSADPDALVQVEVVLRENDNGTPGDELSAGEIAADETFFVEILASAEIPEGIVSFSFDLDFDETVLSSLDGDVLDADGQIPVDNSIITSEFDFQRNGSLDATTGEIFLGAGAVGNSIGSDGTPERFALLQFEALEDITADNSNVLELTVPSDDPLGGGALGDGRALNEVELFVEQQELPPVEELSNGSVVGTVTATDPDEGDNLEALSFSLDDTSVFDIDENGNIFIVDVNALDLETQSSFQLQVTVTDDGDPNDNPLTDTATVNINLTNVNEVPTAEDDTGNTPEDDVLTVDVANGVLANDTDPDEGDTLTVSAVNGNEDDVGTEITLDSGALLTLNANGSYDYDPNGAFEELNDGETDTDTFTYTVSDGNGGTDTAEVTITINGETDNLPPEIVSDVEQEIDENQTEVFTVEANEPDGDEVTFSLSDGADANFFTIDATTGLLSFNEAPDFENPEDDNGDNVYEVQVTADDGVAQTENATETFQITVNDIAPIINDQDLPNLAENSANETVVGTVELDPTGDEEPITFTLTDAPDTDGDGTDAFAIDPDTGEITVNDSDELDFETNDSFTLEVEASDGTNDDADTAEVTINLNNVNEAPVFAQDVFNFDVDENSAAGTRVGTVVVDDPEDEQLTLEIVDGNDDIDGDGEAAFVINDAGEITVNDSDDLDFETREEFALEVIATDPQGLQNTATVDITVNDQEISGDPNEGNVVNVDSSQPLIHTLTGNSDSLVEVGLVLLQPGQTTEAALEAGANVRTVFSVFPDTFDNGEPGTFEELGTIQRILSVVGSNRVGYVLNEGNDQTIDEILAQDTNNLAESFEFDNFNLSLEDNTLTLEAGGVTFEVSQTGEESPLGANLQAEQGLEVFDLTSVDSASTVTAKLSFDLISQAAFDNSIGFYTVDGANGAITVDNEDGTSEVFNPGDDGYLDALLSNVVTDDSNGEEEDIILRGGANVDETSAEDFEVQIQGGQIIVPFIIARGGNLDALPNGADELPLRSDIYTPFIGANSDGADHFRLLADNTFGIEDLRGGGDQDFNDTIFKFEFDVA